MPQDSTITVEDTGSTTCYGVSEDTGDTRIKLSTETTERAVTPPQSVSSTDTTASFEM